MGADTVVFAAAAAAAAAAATLHSPHPLAAFSVQCMH